MLKKTITFEDLDGNQVTEEHYFHLSKADLIEMEVSRDGGMQAYLQKVVSSENGKEIIEAFKYLVRESYGERTPEGRFVKNAQRTEEFMSSEAYSEFFMSLVTDADAAAEFVNGVIPKNLDQDAAKIAAKAQPAETLSDESSLQDKILNSTPEKPALLSADEVAAIDSDELKSGLATGRYKLT